MNKHEKTIREKVSESVSFRKNKTTRILDEIRKYKMDGGKTDEDIRYILGISERSWYRYNRIFNNECKQIWYQLTRDHLQLELLKLRLSLEDTFQKAKLLSEKGNISASDRLDALNTMNEARLDIIRLLRDGPDYIREEQDVQEKQQKLNIEYTALKR
jgi:hypothetical protein